MKFTKHVGKIKNLGRRIIVVTAKIPGKETHALIVDTDSLRDAYLNSLMDAVVSPEAQAADDLGSALMRLPSPENNVTWLMNLHNNNLMFPEPIENIVMYPTPTDPIDLKYAIKLMEGHDYDEVMREKDNVATRSDTLHSYPEVVESRHIADKEVIAMNLISEANRFKMEAEKKLEEAYKIAPQLRPSVTDVEKEVKSLEIVPEEKKVFYVDVGNLGEDDVNNFIAETKLNYEQSSKPVPAKTKRPTQRKQTRAKTK